MFRSLRHFFWLANFCPIIWFYFHLHCINKIEKCISNKENEDEIFCMKRKVLNIDVARYCFVKKDKQSVDSDKQGFFFFYSWISSSGIVRLGKGHLSHLHCYFCLERWKDQNFPLVSKNSVSLHIHPTLYLLLKDSLQLSNSVYDYPLSRKSPDYINSCLECLTFWPSCT